MSELESVAIVTAFWALRCFAPVIVIFTIGYVMKPLLDRWQAQDEALVESTDNTASSCCTAKSS